MQVLTAFLRSSSREREQDEAPPAVQAACNALVQRQRRYDRGLVLDLAGADLRQANMDGVVLQKAILRDTKLRGAFLRSSDLRGANLANAQAESVRLDGANLGKVVLDGARLQGATLDKARAVGAAFVETLFDSTFLRGADLRHCSGLSIRRGKIRGAVTDQHTKF
jgi:uncharacterized protein YjbI with pentapeptide repeats